MAKRISLISLKAVRVDMIAETGVSLGTASGFFCRYNDLIVLTTNWHVVSGRNPRTGTAIHDSLAVPAKIELSLMIKAQNGSETLSTDDLRSGSISIDLYDDDGKPQWFMHPEYAEQVDVVCIPFVSTEAADMSLTCFDIERERVASERTRLWVMEQVFVVGFPLADEKMNNPLPIYKAGTVASEPDIKYRTKPPMFYIDGKTKSGMSGSPVVRKQGTRFEDAESNYEMRSHAASLVGVYSGRDRQERTEFEAELGIVWPLDSCLIPILDSIVKS